jgi:hypothetical protein
MVARVWFSFSILTFSLASRPGAALAVAPSGHQAAGELVDDDHLAVFTM